MKDPFDYALSVHNEATFISFLKLLGADRYDEERKEKQSPSSPYGPGANGWEHSTIGDFLEAAAAWAEAWNSAAAAGKALGTEDVTGNPWQKCALILAMGKVYE